MVLTMLPLAAARGAVIAENIGPGDSYQAGYYLLSNTPDIAVKFTVPVSLGYELDSVTLPMEYILSTNSYTLSVNQDAGGVPGTAVETWTTSGGPGLSTVSSVLDPVLVSGQTYWLLANVSGDTFMGWHLNDQGATSHTYANDGPGWEPTAPTDVAFRITGTPVPEPTSALALASLLLLARKRPRR
jgi:hypothetical protein